MLLKSLAAVSGLLLPAAVSAETILGVTVFTRHGDRASKHYPGYSLTNLGIQQNHQVGADYRSTYISANASKHILGISENKVVNSQLFATAPDQAVLLNTATAFLQGLYPPLEELDAEVASQTLNNGTTYTNPLGGYQYVVLHGEEKEAPDTIYLKGDEGCPAASRAAAAFEQSEVFRQRDEATRAFYSTFWDDMQGVYDYEQPSNMSYGNAYDIFDLLHVASIHNASAAGNVSEQDLFQLRTLADSAEFGLNYNASDDAHASSMGGRTFAGGVVRQLDQVIQTKGKLKFSLMAGSYDTFLAFFGLAGLTSVSDDFYGLPHYASTMAFELFTEADVAEFPDDANDLRVRFLFRNGSDAGAPLQAFPLFGGVDESYAWQDFSDAMSLFSIETAERWCGLCESELLFCQAYNYQSEAQDVSSSSGGISKAVAGVIGAVVTLAVVGIVGAVAFFVLRRRRAAQPAMAAVPANGKSSVRSDTESA
ncbi:phosphoglycerate mutase-like protein [Corynespora cassiicola Philippines]|uniref:Phosphoglycerate mutase-like protein n=1 Tax=Corynespora cassiicola Philippines TaxID=1448308 RepID=A0A2T2N5D6_CORCC|nr:phosphoglycerate mutase-like protein [Corynespora cassiicola Philippines]